MQVWNVLHAACWKYRTQKNYTKNHHLGTITSDCIFATKACIDSRENNVLNSNISSRCHHNMANFGPLTAEITLPVLGTPASFNRFHVLPSLLQWRRSPEANQTLHTIWPSPRLVHYIYIFGGFCPWWNFARCKIHFTSNSCVLLYWQHYCTALQQQAWANLCIVVQKRNYGTFAQGASYIWLGGHHVGPHSSLNVFLPEMRQFVIICHF